MSFLIKRKRKKGRKAIPKNGLSVPICLVVCICIYRFNLI